MIKIAGVVIAYFPDIDKLKFNIGTYIHEIDRLYLVFNSPVSPDIIEIFDSERDKIHLIQNDGNIGVASALNLVAQKALNLGYEWLLTMDQDSCFTNDLFFKAFYEQPGKGKKAIYCPNSDLTAVTQSGNYGETENRIVTITSGNLLCLKIWESLGGFEEKLFIDEVDHDYCLKAVLNGYEIIRFKNIPLIHELGEKKEVNLGFKKMIIHIHTPVRYYYIFRNNFYIFNKYKNKFPEFIRSRKRILLNDFIKIVLFSSGKIQNFLFMIRGIRDYFWNVYGPYGKILL